MDTIIQINRAKCTGCKACIDICPRDCIQLDSENKASFDTSLCHSCGHCISICPESALSHKVFPWENYSLIKDSFDSSTLSPENLYSFLKSIRSTRKFKTKPIPASVLEKVVDLTRFAPTGHHAQNVELTIIQDPTIFHQLIEESKRTIKSLLRKLANPFFALLAFLLGKGSKIREGRKSRGRLVRMLQGFTDGKDYLFHSAPVLVLFHAKKQSVIPADNCTIASTYFRILAERFDLGSCYIGYIVHFAKFNRKIPQILKIPKENELFHAVIVGYPKHAFRRFIARDPIKLTWLK